jgi:RNA polymerase sigma-70 factor (ECF subfamily)
MSNKTDEDIAMAVQNGDVESFALLVDRYDAKLSRYARKFLFGTEDVKDLVQDVFVKAYVNIKSFDARQRFSPWVYRIAHNEFLNALKKKEKSPLLVFDFDLIFPHLVAVEKADHDANTREIREMLDHSLDKLDVKYREPLILYYFEELSYQEIADILRIPVATVGVRLKRGRDMLKDIVPRS